MQLEELIGKVSAAGVVGAGGAGFPAAVKLNAKPEYIVVNGAECEPLLKVDQQLAEQYAVELLKILNSLVEIMGAKEGIFGLKAKYKNAVKNLEAAAKKFPKISIKTLGNYYPMGDEQVLVYEATGRIVPEGGIPLNCGVVVVNVESLLNMAYALEDIPVTEKFVTIAGAVKNPKTFKVPVGVSLLELINEAGGPTVKNPVMINGGPMMGKVEQNLSLPVTKTSKGVIILNDDHSLVVSKTRSIKEMMRIGRTACCHCMLCTDLCPRYLIGHKLHPDKLMRLASYNSTCEKDEAATAAFLCCECAMCEIACIMSLQPWKLNQELKKRLSAAGIKNPHKTKPDQVNPFREYRQYPIPKLIQKLGLAEFEHQEAPLADYQKPVKEVRLLLKQHLGAPSKAVVAQGDKVEKGDLVAAQAEGALGANIHASISGTVTLVNDQLITISA